MKIKHGMILAAGLGKRMQPITFKIPKPLIQIGKKNLIERAIELLVNQGIEEIVINVHHLPGQIKDFINKKKYKVRIKISYEKDKLLDTGGGILHATKSFKKPFLAINPDFPIPAKITLPLQFKIEFTAFIKDLLKTFFIFFNSFI